MAKETGRRWKDGGRKEDRDEKMDSGRTWVSGWEGEGGVMHLPDRGMRWSDREWKKTEEQRRERVRVRE